MKGHHRSLAIGIIAAEDGVNAGQKFLTVNFAGIPPALHIVVINDEGGYRLDAGFFGRLLILIDIILEDRHLFSEKFLDLLNDGHHVPAVRTPGGIKLNENDARLSAGLFVR